MVSSISLLHISTLYSFDYCRSTFIVTTFTQTSAFNANNNLKVK